jgi:phytoene dehydrogenase-like protein
MSTVIIIGSGIGGLVAGNLLAKKGHKVTIFESHHSPGGYVAGFRRNGFYFESGTLSFEASASVFKAMSDIGVLDKIKFVKFKTRFISEDFDSIPQSYPEFKQMLYSAFGSEKVGLDKYFAEVDKMYHAASFSLAKPIPFLLDGLPFVLSMLSFVSGGMKYMKMNKLYGQTTVGEFTAKSFDKQSKLYSFLANMAYPDMAASLLGMATVMVFDDYWTVYDGMQSWADVLAENFRGLGGELKLNSYVDQIMTKDGAAVGVCCNGTRFDADYVIAACDYKKALLSLLDDKSLIPADRQQEIEKAAVSEGFFTIYLGLSLSNDKLKEHLRVPHVAYHTYSPPRDIPEANDDQFFKNTSLGLFSPSLMNPELAPAGKSSLMIQTISPNGWMQNWGADNAKQYKQLKAKVCDTLIKRTEALIPGLCRSIEIVDAATPLTYERFTHNTGGASSAWSWNPHKKFYDNIMSLNIDTPVKNLYIGSCWASQVGGVPGALMAAYMCSKKIR